MRRQKRIFLVAGEHSGDLLGAALMASLARELDEPPVFQGVGGALMEKEGLHSLFPLADVAVMGLGAILPRLPVIVRRVYQAVEAAVRFRPDIVVIIDSPEFTHPIAKRIRKRLPGVPMINYVSPSVWAWRPGRAKRMKSYIDHVLALLPFEPDVHKKLGGPPCTYVGHSLVEKNGFITSCSPDQLRQELQLGETGPVLVVLPGSRSNEVRRLMEPFGEVVGILKEKYPDLHVLLPVVQTVEHLVTEQLRDWPCPVHLLRGEQQKFAAFNLADAALAASGTVTLELGLAKAPMVVAYRMGRAEYSLRHLVSVRSIVLANLVLDENVFPEFLQEDCTPEKLSAALEDLLHDTPALQAQKNGLDLVEKKILLEGTTPSRAAARIVLDFLEK